MQGAREFAGLLSSGQYGRLYIAIGRHARGRTLRIWVLPEGTTTSEKTDWNAPSVPDIVEVYGIVAGQSGWTESYGWIHDGPWVDDFATLVTQRKEQLAWEAEQRAEIQNKRALSAEVRDAALLSSYPSQHQNDRIMSKAPGLYLALSVLVNFHDGIPLNSDAKKLRKDFEELMEYARKVLGEAVDSLA